MKLPDNVKLNDDKAVVERIQKALKKKDGYCPCRLQKIPENICICEEFKQQIADPDFEGFCHCRLYYKSKKLERLLHRFHRRPNPQHATQ